jgi:hypothetical protein
MNPYPGGDSYELPLASNIKIEPSSEDIAHEAEEEMNSNGEENSND